MFSIYPILELCQAVASVFVVTGFLIDEEFALLILEIPVSLIELAEQATPRRKSTELAEAVNVRSFFYKKDFGRCQLTSKSIFVPSSFCFALSNTIHAEVTESFVLL